MTATHLDIKRFVQDTLGCTCPEDVFSRIKYQKEAGDLGIRKIKVGGRLLIYLLNWHGESGLVDAAMENGVAERDTGGFNRFRLVLITADLVQQCAAAEQAFLASAYRDDKTHLHILNESDVMDL